MCSIDVRGPGYGVHAVGSKCPLGKNLLTPFFPKYIIGLKNVHELLGI